MSIKLNHKHVDSEGLVYLPYLHEWKIDSNLVNLISTACKVFSAEPPLFAKPQQASLPSPPVVNSSTSFKITPQTNFSTGRKNIILSINNFTIFKIISRISDLFLLVTNSSSAAYPSPSFMTNSNSRSSTSEVDLDVKRSSLIHEISSKLYENIHTLHSVIRDELNTEFNTEHYLTVSQEAAEKKLQSLQQTVEQMRAAIEEVQEKSAALTQWDEEEAKKPQVDVESRFQPYDDLTSQIVKLNAEISAIDDAFYHMERSLVASQNKTLDLNSFLKEMRKLARQQFLCKAHLLKINAVCMQQSQIQQQQQVRVNQQQQQQQRQAEILQYQSSQQMRY